MTNLPGTGLQVRTHIKPEGVLELSLAEVEVAAPGSDEVVVRVEAAPVNPSDLGLLIGPADLSTARAGGTADNPTLIADISPAGMRAMGARMDESLPVGNEGAGVVIAAGDSPAAQALLGKTVACLGGEMYSQYRKLHVSQCLLLPDGTSARDGASCFVNPLTALSFPETMRMEGHKALVHTAAASNLGQMLNKICIEDGVDVVNIVRKEEQAEILRKIGAKYIVNSSSETFMEDLIDALAATGATLGFDAIGGGSLAGRILIAMEAAINRTAKEYSRYGSATHKQVYIYGRLDVSQTVLPASVGMAWGVGGYLLTPFLQKVGAEARERMRQRVIAGLQTTFASHYSDEISMKDLLNPDVARAYNAKATGEKYLVNPTL